jgi:thymidylate synthase (FAD)
MQDKWRQLRSDLWANTEPSIDLVAMTIPGGFDNEDSEHYFNTSGVRFYAEHIDPVVAQAASVSTGVTPKHHASLIRTLIKLKHYTPLESIQFNFHVTGISKACGAQLSRHRIGQGHVSSSRRYQEQGAAFVYPLLENIEDQDVAQKAYCLIQDSYKQSYSDYQGIKALNIKKGDCRYVIPTASAQERMWWVNARALRDFFRLRLPPTAEAEIRRLALMTLRLARQITPTLFDDITGD